MRASPRVMCCWPGLPRLWCCGDWLSLATALAFGGALNLLLAFATVRPNWLPWTAQVAAWLVLGGVWAVTTARACRAWPHLLTSPRAAGNEGLFLQAQSEYLQGHWFEAEQKLMELVRHSHRDVEARLLLATLYRHTRRFDEADSQLHQLEQLDGSDKWQFEITAERRLMGRREL